MNPYLALLLFLLTGQLLFRLGVEMANMRHLRATFIPQEVAGLYDPNKYHLSQEYTREKTKLYMVELLLGGGLLFLLLLTRTFDRLEIWARAAGQNPLVSDLIFLAVIFLATSLFELPFSILRTFYIEERYGFNRTKVATFIMDWFKTFLLEGILGGIIALAVLILLTHGGEWSWIYCFGAVSLLSLIFAYLLPSLVLPLFNTFTPFQEGNLKDRIEAYAKQQNFHLNGLFTMDGSSRSTHANAFFVGFGKNRRIVLFDTLMQNHNDNEIMAILAHEMGHFKLKHILKGTTLSLLHMGFLFYLLSLFLKNLWLTQSLGFSHPSLAATLFSFFLFYTPLAIPLNIASKVISRRFEFEADQFAEKTVNHPEALSEALKKLSVDNLTNLTPHPCKVFVDYSHPPLLQRLKALES